MRCPWRVLWGVLVIATAASGLMSAQVAAQATKSTAAAATYTSPRTPWGDPDLQGTWRTIGLPLERPEGKAVDARRTDAEIQAGFERSEKLNAMRLAGKGESRGFRANPNMNDVWVARAPSEKPAPFSRRLWGIVDPPDGRLPPWTLEQVKRWEYRLAETAKHGDADTLANRTYNERCINHYAPPTLSNWGLEFGGRQSTFGGRFETITDNVVVSFMDGLNSSTRGGGIGRIIQAPGWVVLLDPGYESFRFIPLGKRQSVGQGIRSWAGDTYGYFEGDTLVVEVTNIQYDFPLIPGYFGGEYPGTGEKLKVVERYRRVGPEGMVKSYTVTDPDVYVRPYTAELEAYLDDNFKDLPSICHEVNLIDLGGLLATARLDEAGSWENMREVEVELDKWFQMRKQLAIEYANASKTQSAR